MASVRKREWTHKGAIKTAWVVNYTDQGGKRRLKTFDLKKDADRYRTQVETEIEKGIHTPDAESVTVARACDLYRERLEARARVGDGIGWPRVRNHERVARNHIAPLIGNMLLTRLTAPTVQKYIDDLRFAGTKPRSAQTVKTAVNELSMVLQEAQRHGLIGVNIVRQARPRVPDHDPKEITIPSKEIAARLLASATGIMRPMLHVAIFAGLRFGEIRALTWDYVDFEQRILRVRQASDMDGLIKGPKTRAGRREVPIGPVLGLILKEWKLASPRNEGNYVFATTGRPHVGHTMSAQNFHRNYWRPFLAGLGFADADGENPQFRFHDMRHLAASLWIDQGLQPKRIQQLMGHASIQMTYDRYGHLFDDQESAFTAAAAIEAKLVPQRARQ